MKIIAMVQTHSKTLARGAELRGGSSRIVGRGCDANLGGADLMEVSGERATPNCQALFAKRLSEGFQFPCGSTLRQHRSRRK